MLEIIHIHPSLQTGCIYQTYVGNASKYLTKSGLAPIVHPLLSNGALIAQLDRVSGFEPEGCRFESCWAYHCKFKGLRATRESFFALSAKQVVDCWIGIRKKGRIMEKFYALTIGTENEDDLEMLREKAKHLINTFDLGRQNKMDLKSRGQVVYTNESPGQVVLARIEMWADPAVGAGGITLDPADLLKDEKSEKEVEAERARLLSYNIMIEEITVEDDGTVINKLHFPGS